MLIQGGGGSWAEADPPGLIYQSPATARVDYNLQKRKKVIRVAGSADFSHCAGSSPDLGFCRLTLSSHLVFIDT